MRRETMMRAGRLGLRRAALLCGAAIASLGLTLSAHATTYSVLYSFHGKPNDGAGAVGSLMQDRTGNLYGTTNNGGPYDFGTVFKIDPAGTETVLAKFQYDNGALPQPGLIRHKGILYDTTNGGGYNGAGAVVKVNDRGKVDMLYSFCSLANCADGSFPQYGVTSDSAGNLYGTTNGGGAYGFGTVCSKSIPGEMKRCFTTSVPVAAPAAMGAILRGRALSEILLATSTV